jgi:hypothetical protein
VEYLYAVNRKRLVVDLNLRNIDIKQWPDADGTEGVWFGLGFGEIVPEIKEYDLMMCQFKYYGENSQQEVECFDRWWDGETKYGEDAISYSMFKMSSS